MSAFFWIENAIGGDMGLVSLETVCAKKRYSETELARVETIYIIKEK